MKMIVLGGFLGSGKTSILIQLAKHLVGGDTDKYSKVVIIENEIGEVGIDDKLLRAGGYLVEGMFAGCVCCSISGELIVNVSEIMKNLEPEWIIMEATGVATPITIKENLLESLRIDSGICCIADAKRWKRYLVPMRLLMETQLEGADVILINKIDAVDEKELDEIEESVKSFNNEAAIFRVSAADTISSEVFDAVLEKLVK